MMALSRNRWLAKRGFKRLEKLRILGWWLKRKRKAIGSRNRKVDESPVNNGNSNPDCLDELQAKSMAIVQPGPESKAWEVCRERDEQFGAMRAFPSLTDGNTTEREKAKPETQETLPSLPTSGPRNALSSFLPKHSDEPPGPPGLPQPPGAVPVAVPKPRPVSQTSQCPQVHQVPQSPLVQPSLAHVIGRPQVHSHMTQRGQVVAPRPKPFNIFQKQPHVQHLH